MELPPGRTRVDAREDARTTLEAERVLEAQNKRSADHFMDVDHQLKQARVVGMKAQAAQIALQTIQTKPNVEGECGSLHPNAWTARMQ
jgi:hypothetical protein